MRAKDGAQIRRSSAGFSLVELLVTLLILALATTVIASGMPLAIGAYNKVVDSSNAQVLVSTASTLLRDELGNAAGEIAVSEGNTVIYTRGTGYPAELYTKDNSIFIKELTSRSEGLSEHEEPLVSDEAATNGLQVTYDSVSEPTDGVVTISGLKVNKYNEEGNAVYSEPLAELDTLKIRILTQ